MAMAEGHAPLHELEQNARVEHPHLHVPAGAFAQYAAARVLDDTSFNQLNAADLYLACACALRLDGAAQRLAELHEKVLRETLRKALGDASLADEATQVTFERMLSGKLTGYSGHGPLSHWLAVVGLRTGLELRGPASPQNVDWESLLEAPAEVSDPDLVRKFGRESVKRAIEEAVKSLSAKERTLLRLNVLEGLNIATLGQMYAVHRATVARWIAGAREQLLKETREHLRRTLKIEGAELESLLRLADSKLELSLSVLL